MRFLLVVVFETSTTPINITRISHPDPCLFIVWFQNMVVIVTSPNTPTTYKQLSRTRLPQPPRHDTAVPHACNVETGTARNFHRALVTAEPYQSWSLLRVPFAGSGVPRVVKRFRIFVFVTAPRVHAAVQPQRNGMAIPGRDLHHVDCGQPHICQNTTCQEEQIK